MITRYKESVEPTYSDGRDIDSSVGALIGEGAQQISDGSPDQHIQTIAEVWTTLPEPKPSDPTYYDRPVLKEPVWEWAIPLYYYVGGLTGASLALAAAVQFRSDPEAEALVKQCHWIGLLGSMVSGGLLIYDLGRPARFLNMLRVFRPTSPMNVGAWILSGTGAGTTATMMLWYLPGQFRPLAKASAVITGVFGLGLATYTGVLVASTAVPLWQASRRALPALFGASALTSVGSAYDLFPTTNEQHSMTRTFGNVGKVLELAAAHFMDRQASAVPRVGLPLKKGFCGLLWRGSAALIGSSLIVSLLPRQTRRKQVTAGLLGTLGSLLLRYTVQHAGVLSARDPRATFHQQRAGAGAQEVTGMVPTVP